MSARVVARRQPMASSAGRATHVLVVVAAGSPTPDAPGGDEVRLASRRSGADTKPGDANTVQLVGGQLVTWVTVDASAVAFDRHTALRKAVAPLLAEHPAALAIAVHGTDEQRAVLARDAVYVALVNGDPLPSWKRGKAPRPLGSITVHGVPVGVRFDRELALAAGNRLCRELTAAPPNLLGPAAYRERVATLAVAEGWKRQEFGLARLARLGAGAFLAVARGSHQGDAAIVRLTYDGRPAGARGRAVALVGKGICFDTGGHNLKHDKGMNEMHTDMSGSAVALGALLAAARLHVPIRIDAWLAIAQNHLSPSAYTQNEVVVALDGTTVEVTHTDAEGRMVLADTLALAARERPDEIVDFATLTGSMVAALGTRMSGVIANREELAEAAVAAGVATGERVVAFPMPADYDELLESKVADVKQCLLESGHAATCWRRGSSSGSSAIVRGCTSTWLPWPIAAASARSAPTSPASASRSPCTC